MHFHTLMGDSPASHAWIHGFLLLFFQILELYIKTERAVSVFLLSRMNNITFNIRRTMNTSWLNLDISSAIPRISRTLPGISATHPGISGTFPRNSGKHILPQIQESWVNEHVYTVVNFNAIFPPCLNSPIKHSLSQKLSQTQSVPKYAQNYPYATFSKKGTQLKKMHKWECSICTFVWAILCILWRL